MHSTSLTPQQDLYQYAIWLISLVMIAFGFRFARDIIGLVLEKLHEIFIQNNPVY